jgi:hypothetical protein
MWGTYPPPPLEWYLLHQRKEPQIDAALGTHGVVEGGEGGVGQRAMGRLGGHRVVALAAVGVAPLLAFHALDHLQ